ncbi:hypothetical protein SNEBB_001216 [Seison nebaliae]|nr:hypothetical protein SNEBB_001216 [Seison nebaliae]
MNLDRRNTESGEKALHTKSELRSHEHIEKKYRIKKLKHHILKANGATYGLVNLGNTCFMNSTLHCLSNSPELIEFFLKNGCYEDKTNFLGAAARLFCKMWEERENLKMIAPHEVLKELSIHSKSFSDGKEQDAHEFLLAVLQLLHDDLNVKRGAIKNSLKPKEEEAMDDVSLGNYWWNKYLAVEFSPIMRLFVGQFFQSITCTTCYRRSRTYDPFWGISLSIPEESINEAITINDCLDVFFKTEILEGNCKYCKGKRKAKKIISTRLFPRILFLHLKRFSYNLIEKVETDVIFSKYLELSKYDFYNNRTIEYELYGIIEHIGGVSSGHYIAKCLHPVTNTWRIFDDASVEVLEEDNLMKTANGAYILFYRQTGIYS